MKYLKFSSLEEAINFFKDHGSYDYEFLEVKDTVYWVIPKNPPKGYPKIYYRDKSNDFQKLLRQFSFIFKPSLREEYYQRRYEHIGILREMDKSCIFRYNETGLGSDEIAEMVWEDIHEFYNLVFLNNEDLESRSV